MMKLDVTTQAGTMQSVRRVIAAFPSSLPVLPAIGRDLKLEQIFARGNTPIRQQQAHICTTRASLHSQPIEPCIFTQLRASSTYLHSAQALRTEFRNMHIPAFKC